MLDRPRLRRRHTRLAVAAVILATVGVAAGAAPGTHGVPIVTAADPSPAPTMTPGFQPANPPRPGRRIRPMEDVDGLPLAGQAAVSPTAVTTPRPIGRRAPRPALPGRCRGWSGAMRRADEALVGKYELGSHPVVNLGLDPTWREDPLNDRNWQFMHHSMTLVLSLLEAWVTTADIRYYDRAEFLLRDWYEENPRVGAPSIWSWNDHSTALRAIVYSCALPYFPATSWMISSLDLHGRTLADPGFYVQRGNHALNQSLGLFETGLVRERTDWRDLAVARINRLIAESIDSQGVTNEQSVGYQVYNYSRYVLARQRLLDLGYGLAPEFSRVDRMPGFLAHATVPNGTLEMLGDTDYGGAPGIVGTTSEFAATGGASGPRPANTWAVYKAGFLFARSGWGDTRPFADEVFTSLRFGPAPFIHGHADATSVTLYGYGSRLIVDPGKYTYNSDAYRTFFKGRTAHNVVTVDGLTWSPTAASTLVKHTETSTMIDATVTTAGYGGVSQTRHSTFSRRLNYLIVDDRANATVARTFRQLWHLDETAAPVVATNSFRTTHARGNVLVRQLIAVSSSRVVTGRTSPVQGWIAYEHGVKVRAPVVEVVKSGTSVRYLTLLVPAAGTPAATVSGLTLTATGYSVTITIGSHAERVVVSGTSASITTIR